MEIVSENDCKNVFVSDKTEIREEFTKLWTQVINEKENNINFHYDVKTNTL